MPVNQALNLSTLKYLLKSSHASALFLKETLSAFPVLTLDASWDLADFLSAYKKEGNSSPSKFCYVFLGFSTHRKSQIFITIIKTHKDGDCKISLIFSMTGATLKSKIILDVFLKSKPNLTKVFIAITLASASAD